MAATHNVTAPATDNAAPAGARPGRADLRALGVAAVLGAGLAYGAAAARHRRTTRGRRTMTPNGRRGALASYIREHLGGSDTAILVLERVRRSHAGTKEGSLFASLYDQIERERDLLRTLLGELGETSLSPKRVATKLTGSLLGAVAGGNRDDLSLFWTLEGLSMGVQGKRCMWRALQSVDQGFAAASPQRFAELETLAQRQWEEIEQCRVSLVPDVFGGAERARPEQGGGAQRNA